VGPASGERETGAGAILVRAMLICFARAFICVAKALLCGDKALLCVAVRC